MSCEPQARLLTGSTRDSEMTGLTLSMGVMAAFYADANPDLVFECEGFDEPWNGWCTPIVSWEAAFDVLQDAEWLVRTEGAVIFAASDAQMPEDEIVMLEPDANGLYHLRDLGWTLVEAPTYDAKVLPFERPRP